METNAPALMGNEELLGRPSTAFLCSRRVPDETFAVIRQWVESLCPERDCVLCGCLSGTERFAARLLLERGIPLVLMLAEALPEDPADVSRKVPDLVLSEAMGAGRLLVVSINDDAESTSATGANADARNRWMMDTAERTVVAYAQPYGNLDCQTIGHPRVSRLVEPLATPSPTEKQRESMGWSIYRSLRDHVLNLSSTDIRRLLHRYLLLDTPRPSLLHSLVLLFVVREWEHLGELNFPAFLRMWGTEHLRPEDWQKTKVNGHYVPSLAERVLARLSRSEPERQDTKTIATLSEQGMRLFPKNLKYKVYRLRAAQAGHDRESILRLAREMLRQKDDSRLWLTLAEQTEELPLRGSLLCRALSAAPTDPRLAWAHLLLGETLLQMKHPAEALHELDLYRLLRERQGKTPGHKYERLMERIPKGTKKTPTDATFYGSHTDLARAFVSGEGAGKA